MSSEKHLHIRLFLCECCFEGGGVLPQAKDEADRLVTLRHKNVLGRFWNTSILLFTICCVKKSFRASRTDAEGYHVGLYDEVAMKAGRSNR